MWGAAWMAVHQEGEGVTIEMLAKEIDDRTT
jgi:hypothetical protein